MIASPGGPVALVFSALEARDLRPVWRGAHVSSRCPAHDDRAASLSVSPGDDGRALIHCHAGCRAQEVASCLGLKMADLFPPGSKRNGNNGSGKPGGRPQQGKIVATYDYFDPSGKLLMQVVRLDPKGFRQRRPDPAGGWVWKTSDVDRVLYRLPALPAAIQAGKTVWIVEGEKDVHTAESIGLVATTNPGGAGKWRPSYSESLRSANVRILPDRDDVGMEHARQVSRSLEGLAASVKILSLPGPGKDISDHVQAWRAGGLSATQVVATLEALPELEPGPPPEVDLTTGYTQTDTGNAERLLALHGQDLRYCHLWGKWLTWDGSRWEQDDRGMAKAWAIDAGRQLLAQAPDDEWEEYGRKCLGASKINSLLDLARSLEGVPVLHTELDSHPMLLATPSGTVDLATGVLRPAKREDLLLRQTRTPFNPAAKAPTWERFLSEIQADQEVTAYLARMVGYSLTGLTDEQVLFFLHGAGSNGKSTFLSALQYVLGEYAHQANQTLLIQTQFDRHPTELASLHGRRLVCCTEVDEGARLNEALVKQLTGGDTICARRMREDEWTFQATHKLFIAANAKPVIRGTDYAIWRRIHLVPFTVQFEGDRKDPRLLAKLKAEAEGILAWAVRGCLEWQRVGLQPPQAVMAASEDYRAESDVVGQWIDEKCRADGYRCKAGKLYESYRQWAMDSGEPVLSSRRWGDELTRRGFRVERCHGAKYRVGIDLMTGESDGGWQGI